MLFFWNLTHPPTRTLNAVRPSFLEPDNNLTESASLLSELVVSPDINQQEQLTTLSNSKLTVTFSTLGGSIKRIVMNEYDVSLPLTHFNQMEDQNNLNYRIIEKNDSFIKYSANFEGNQIIKQYSLLPNEYIIKININTNLNTFSKIKGFRLDVSSLDKNTRQAHDKSLLEYSIATTQKVIRKANAYKLSNKDILNSKESVSWLGFRDRYFCAIYKPLFKNQGYNTKFNNDKLDFIIEADNNVGNNLGAVLFFGPQDLSLLASYPYEFDGIMRFSNFGILNSISKIVYNFLHFIYKIIPIWGVCIILTAILVYFIMYPLSINGMKSMKKIQSLQPEITKIREQHKNNPQKLQKETMELYKRHQVNPFGGCLPLLLQMPFFIGVYQVLWRSVAFKNAKFLWIKDLSQPDHLFAFPTSLPFVGEYFNLLPILMIIIMVIQQKFSAKNMVITDPAQESSQKIMMFFFPLMIGFVFYNIASGLALYFTTFYLLSSFTQWKISKIT